MIAAFGALALSVALPAASLDERQMLRVARDLMATYGEPLWHGYSYAPFDTDLVFLKEELLLCRKSEFGFSTLTRDVITECSAQMRDRLIPTDLAAANDMFSDPPETIQIGTPEALGIDRGDWIATVIHERFHLYQATLPSFQAQERRMGTLLGKGSGAWMLDYPWPYSDIHVHTIVAAMCADGEEFLNSASTTSKRRAIALYVRDRNKLAASVAAKDMAYWEFQIGKEGVAKWTETAVVSAAAATAMYPELRAAATQRQAGLAVSLKAIGKTGNGMGLANWRRSIFYVFGPLEANMLTYLHQDWRRKYTARPFSFGAQLAAACPDAISNGRC